MKTRRGVRADRSPSPFANETSLGPEAFERASRSPAVTEFVTKAPPAGPAPECGPDRELVAKVRRADRAAFDALYEAYFFRIFRYFGRRFETTADAERATEAALIAIFHDISNGTSQVPLSHWIFRVVRAEKDWGPKSPQPPEAAPGSSVAAAPLRS